MFKCLHRLTVREDIFCDAEIGYQTEFLEDHTDAFAVGVMGGIKTYDFAFNENFAVIGLVDAAEGQHQSAFSCPVFTNNGVNFPFAKTQIYAVKSTNAGKCFNNTRASRIKSDIFSLFSCGNSREKGAA